MRWTEIKDTSYVLSDTGIVINKKTGKELKPSKRRYPTVRLCTNGEVEEIALHRLVAEYYVPNPDNLPIVRHKDGDTSNYAYTNLCWGTYSDNMEDAIQRNENPSVIGTPVVQYLNGKVIAKHRSFAAAARAIGLANPSNSGASHIKAVCDGKQKTAKGFTFAYEKGGDSYPLE